MPIQIRLERRYTAHENERTVFGRIIRIADGFSDRRHLLLSIAFVPCHKALPVFTAFTSQSGQPPGDSSVFNRLLKFPQFRLGMPPVMLAALVIGAAVRIAAMNAGSLLPLVMAQNSEPSIAQAKQPVAHSPAFAGLFDPTSSLTQQSPKTDSVDRISPKSDWPTMLKKNPGSSIAANRSKAQSHLQRLSVSQTALKERSARTTIEWITTEPSQQNRLEYFDSGTCAIRPAG